MKKYIFVFSFLFLMFSTVSVFAGKPKWINSPNIDYPSKDYLCAVGSGSDRSAAESSAKFSLCQILGEQLSGVQNIIQSSDSNGSDFAKLDISVQEKVLFEKIVGINIKESYSETEKISVKQNGKTKKQKVKVYYALAVLKKSEAISYYTSLVSDNSREIASLQTKADMASSSDDPSQKINAVLFMRKALKIAEDNEYNVQILSAIQGVKQSVSYISVQTVKNKLKSISENIRISVTVAGDDGGKISAQFKSVIKKFGFTIANDNDFSFILKSELSFENVDGASLAKNVRDGSEYKYVRYNLHSEVVTRDGSNILFPYECSGREGHVSESQARTRSVQKICSKIEEEFFSKFEDYLNK